MTKKVSKLAQKCAIQTQVSALQLVMTAVRIQTAVTIQLMNYLSNCSWINLEIEARTKSSVKTTVVTETNKYNFMITDHNFKKLCTLK